MYIKSLTMRYANYFRVAIEKVSEDVAQDIVAGITKIDPPGYVGLRCKENIKYVSFEVEMYQDSNHCTIVYFFEDYKEICDYGEDSEVYKLMKSFIDTYGNKYPDNSELLLGDVEYLSLPEVQKLNDEYISINKSVKKISSEVIPVNIPVKIKISEKKMKEAIITGVCKVENGNEKFEELLLLADGKPCDSLLVYLDDKPFSELSDNLLFEWFICMKREKERLDSGQRFCYTEYCFSDTGEEYCYSNKDFKRHYTRNEG